VQVLGFRRKGIRLTVELLHEEIEASAGGLTAVDYAADFLDVAGQAIEFLINIESLQEHGQLLLETILVDIGFELREALIQSRTYARMHFGKTCTHMSHERFQTGTALLE